MTGPAGAIPPEVLTRFTLAEGRLYPMVLSDPERYARAITLVGLVVEELRGQCADLESVIDRRDALIAALPSFAEANQRDLDGVPADAVVDAASALRCRELQAQA